MQVHVSAVNEVGAGPRGVLSEPAWTLGVWLPDLAGGGIIAV